jgi:hypothetical protein
MDDARKTAPQPEPTHRQLVDEFAAAARDVPPQQYAHATARAHVMTQRREARRRRFAKM